MKKISLVLSLALLMIVVFAFNVFAATTNDITNDARLEQNGSSSDLLNIDLVKDGNYNTASSCGNEGENWVNYRFYYDEGTTVSKVFVVLNSTGTLSNGTVYETVSANSYEFYVRLYDKYENVVIGTKYHSVNNATQVTDDEGNVLYTYFEVVFDEPYSDIYMVEVPVVNNKNADVGLWEVEIYNYVCGDDEHNWVGTLCGEHCDVCGEIKDPTLACEAEEDDGDCRTAVLCKYCDSVMVASKKHVFANGETVCSNDGCVFEGKNIAKDTSITPVDVTENSYGENGEFMNWWYYSAHITDGKYDTIAHSNYWGQYKFTFTIKNPTTLSEIFIVSNSSGIYHPWGYGHDNLTTDLAVKVIIYDADGNAIQTVEYQSLDFTNPNVVPIYAENGEMTSVGYKLDTNYATASKIELYINQGVWEVEIYEHVTCDYQFIETVAPGCTTEGYDSYKCACGDERRENTVAALGHNYDEGVVTKEATEEEDGEIVYTCAVCGGTKTLAIPATGHEHNYDTYVGNSVEPTCAIVGSATYQCRCGDTTEVEIPATGNHNYNVFVAYTVEPTYLVDGYADYKCATCDGTINVNVGRLQMNTAKYADATLEMGGWTAAGVKYLIDGNYNVGCAGSHSTNGWAFSLNYGEDYTFTKLAFVVNSVGSHPVPPFSYTDKTTKNYSFAITLYDANGNAVWTKSTTCADAVEKTGVDADGNNFLYDIVTIELDEAVVASKLYVKINSGWDNGAGMWEVETYGLPVNYHEVHDYTVELERYSNPTCAVDGSALYRCAKCDTTSVKAIPATGEHNFNVEVDGTRVNATCTDKGSVTMKCATCDATEEKALDALGHTEGEAVVENSVAAGCETAGSYDNVVYCTVCNAELSRETVTVEATGHSYEAVVTAPDCVNDGYTTHTCTACGNSYVDNYVDATGHKYTVETVEPTCTEEGYVKSTCSVCGEIAISDEKTPALGHTGTYGDDYVYVGATCVAPGYTSDICSVCSEEFTTILPVDTENGHDWDDGSRNEADTGTIYTCNLCGATKEEITLGTAAEPIEIVIGENVVPTINNPEALDIWFYLPVTEYGKYTITVAETVGVKHAPNAMALYRAEFEYGKTTYEIVVDPSNGNQYPVVFTTDVTSFNVTFEAMEYPTIDLGENALVGSVDGNKYVVKVPGEYILSAAEGETNAVVNVVVVHPMFGTMTEWVDLPYTFTVNEGETVTFIINTGDWSEEDEINLVLSLAHTHTEVEIPAVRPTPSVTGYTAGVKCAECGEELVAPVAVELTQQPNGSANTWFRFSGAYLTLQESIAVNYQSIITSGYNNVYAVFVFNGEEYIVERNGSSNIFVFDELLPQHMNVNVAAYLFAETGEGTYAYNVVATYSVKQYCLNQLKAAYASNDTALITMISDVLTYGAAVQEYTSYVPDTESEYIDDIVGETYTLTPSVYNGTGASENKQAVTGDKSTNTNWCGVGLLMGSNTVVNIEFRTDNIEGLAVKINVGGKDTYITEFTKSGDVYTASVDFVWSSQYDDVITATFERDGVQFSSTFTYSINTYCVKYAEDASFGTRVTNMIKALYVYGQSVRAYFGN